MIETLLRDAFRYDFYQAVRLLEQACGNAETGLPRRNPVGTDSPANTEVVRFRALPSLSFQPGGVNKLEPARGQSADSAPLQMTVGFMGLFGPSGVLPQHYTSLMLSRMREKDFALREFLDLFNHRAISFLYRAWEKYRFPFAYERADRQGKEDLFTQCLLSLVGLGTGGLRGRLDVNDESFAYFAGHFSRQVPQAATLENMLSAHFGLPFRVHQFCGQWLYLDDSNRSRLSTAKTAEDSFNQLGMSVVVGERIWDVQSRFRLVVGPLNGEQFRRLMPGGDLLRPAFQFCRSYVGLEFDFDVQLVLKPGEVPWCQLTAENLDRPRLGLNTWLRSREFVNEVNDAVFCLEDA